MCFEGLPDVLSCSCSGVLKILLHKASRQEDKRYQVMMGNLLESQLPDGSAAFGVDEHYDRQ